mmetsp:Transcript_3114/g.8536  ORF Transcript_3114/g.8536 Transcript_3114/m.8536 type:complete len:529 (+) Transcript_3114:1859-3445(+)
MGASLQSLRSKLDSLRGNRGEDAKKAARRRNKSKVRKFNPSRVAAEIIMQCALNHPNLVQLSGVYLSATHIGLVMELVKGGELYGYIKEYPIPERILFPHRGTESSRSESKKKSASRRSSKKKQDDDDGVAQGLYVLSRKPRDEKFRKHLDEERALYFFKQVLSGVSYCHRHHIAHRDLKLTNVLIDTAVKPPELKICDFGLSKHWITPPERKKKDEDVGEDSGDTEGDSIADSAVSDFEKKADPLPLDDLDPSDVVFARCRTRVGSPMYVAREIVAREFCIDGYDGTAVDVWSMGIMLYYMLRGKFPFPDFNGKGSMEILKRIPSRVKTDLLKNDLGKSELSDEVIDLLNRMLRFDISQRIKLDQIYDHPWVAREQSEERLEEIFAPLYSQKKKKRPEKRSLMEGIMQKMQGWFTSSSPLDRRQSDKSTGHSTAIDSDECDITTSRSSSVATSDGLVAEEETGPSGKKFPTDCWLEVKEMVYRASHTIASPGARVEVWRPPFGPFRLTFSTREAAEMDRREKAMSRD